MAREGGRAAWGGSVGGVAQLRETVTAGSRSCWVWGPRSQSVCPTQADRMLEEGEGRLWLEQLKAWWW